MNNRSTSNYKGTNDHNEMNEAEFKEYVIHKIKCILNESQRIVTNSVWKNNGICEEGIVIMEEGNNSAPTIYISDYYNRYKKGENPLMLAREIYDTSQKFKVQKELDIKDFLDFEKAKGQIVYKLVNRKLNEKLLKKIPYMPYMDLALVYYYMLENEELGSASILIHKSHVQMWKVSEKELYNVAIENTPKLLPEEFVCMGEVIDSLLQDKYGFEDSKNSDDEAQEYENEVERGKVDMMAAIGMEESEIPMYVLTNSKKLNGAATIVYPGILGRFADQLKSNLFIIPSSIHEVIIVPENRSENEPEMLNHMVREVNRDQLDPREILSDHVYYYDRGEKCLMCK